MPAPLRMECRKHPAWDAATGEETSPTKHFTQALHECDMGESPHTGGSPLRRGALWRILQYRNFLGAFVSQTAASSIQDHVPGSLLEPSKTQTRIAAYLLVEYLERLGVEVVFGLCGHTVIALLDALGKSRIRFVSTRHEQVAAHAADGYARASGKTGVLLTH